MVEGAALEMLYRGNPIEGSNPSLSVPKAVFIIKGLVNYPNFPEM